MIHSDTYLESNVFRKEREENSKMVVESWIMGKLLDFNHQSLTLRFMEVAKRGDMHSKGQVIQSFHAKIQYPKCILKKSLPL